MRPSNWQVRNAYPMKFDSQTICSPSSTRAPACLATTIALSDAFWKVIPCILILACSPFISKKVPAPPSSNDLSIHAPPATHEIVIAWLRRAGGSWSDLAIWKEGSTTPVVDVSNKCLRSDHELIAGTLATGLGGHFLGVFCALLDAQHWSRTEICASVRKPIRTGFPFGTSVLYTMTTKLCQHKGRWE